MREFLAEGVLRMRRRGPPRVLGPYAEPGGFRLIVVEDCARRSLLLRTREEALGVQAALSEQMQRPPVHILDDVLAEWTAERVRSEECQPETASHQLGRLRLFLAEKLRRDIAEVLPEQAAKLYEELTITPSPKTGVPLSAASHRFTLAAAKQFFQWATRRGYVQKNPFQDVRPTGKVHAGKPQLRIDEARRFVAAAEKEFLDHGTPLAVGALLALLMGLRTGEVLDRVVRDVDNDGHNLWIDAGKTRNARRHLEVPQLLRPLLLRLAADKPPTAPLFAGADGGVPTRQAMHRLVRRLCARAQVPQVCTHSLRGLYATLAVRSGAVTHAVAASLGHHSFEVTTRHYAEPEAVADATTARVLEVLGPGTPAAAQAVKRRNPVA